MRYFLAILSIFFAQLGLAQQLSYDLNQQFSEKQERKSLIKESKVHSASKPIVYSRLYINPSETIEYEKSFRKTKTKWLGRKLFIESFIEIDTGNFYMQIDPLASIQLNKFDTTQAYTNGRGLRVQGNIGRKFSFYSSFMENQSFYYGYQKDFVVDNNVVPGNARVKRFKDTGFDYAMASGYFSYSPNKNFNFQFGHSKNFIGEGHRSLLLSDNTFNYLNFKSSILFFKDKIQYTSIFASLQNLQRVEYYESAENPFIRKAASFHYLSFKPHSMVELGLFEGVIWQRYDSTGTQPINPQQFNPLIGLNTLTEGLSGINNSLLGFNFKLTPVNHLAVYGQYMLDEKTKNGYQIGLKSVDVFKLKNLFIQLEYNTLSVGVYETNNLQGYSHYNLQLGSSLRSNSQELYGRISYSFKGLFLNLQTNYILYGDAEVQIINPELGYMFNRSSNFNIAAGYFSRNETKFATNSTSDFNYMYLTFRTSIGNQYWDF